MQQQLSLEHYDNFCTLHFLFWLEKKTRTASVGFKAVVHDCRQLRPVRRMKVGQIQNHRFAN
jgi:hypothetical protein